MQESNLAVDSLRNVPFLVQTIYRTSQMHANGDQVFFGAALMTSRYKIPTEGHDGWDMPASNAGSRCEQVIVILDFATPGGRSALDPGLFSLTHSGSLSQNHGGGLGRRDGLDGFSFMNDFVTGARTAQCPLPCAANRDNDFLHSDTIDRHF
jgi:hypothetical protein